jgi:hypothetical protein
MPIIAEIIFFVITKIVHNYFFSTDLYLSSAMNTTAY